MSLYRSRVIETFYEVVRVSELDGHCYRSSVHATKEEAIAAAISLIKNGEKNAPHISEVTEISY